MSTPPPPPPPGMPPPPPAWGAGGMPSAGPNLASPGKRIGARLIDAIIAIVVGLVIFTPLVLAEGESISAFGTGDGVDSGKLFTIALLGSLFGFLYEAVLTKVAGGTPGKLILGMRVVRAADGAPVGWGESILRWVVPAVVALIPGLGGLLGLVLFIINLVFLFTDKLRQTLWDKIAKTIVVNK